MWFSSQTAQRRKKMTREHIFPYFAELKKSVFKNLSWHQKLNNALWNLDARNESKSNSTKKFFSFFRFNGHVWQCVYVNGIECRYVLDVHWKKKHAGIKENLKSARDLWGRETILSNIRHCFYKLNQQPCTHVTFPLIIRLTQVNTSKRTCVCVSIDRCWIFEAREYTNVIKISSLFLFNYKKF